MVYSLIILHCYCFTPVLSHYTTVSSVTSQFTSHTQNTDPNNTE